jgi:UDP-2,3-diacylglucosamine pyrophosphatase LpxH
MFSYNKTFSCKFLALVFLFINGFIISQNISGQRLPAKNQLKSKQDPSFLFLSDIHLNSTTDTTAYGADTGMNLWANFLKKVDFILDSDNPPGFVVYTGDLPAHYHCDPSCYLPPEERTTHNQNLTVILTGLRNLASKYNTPFFYLPGNNDGLAGDYFSFTDEQQQTPFSLLPDSANPYPALNILQGTNQAPCIISNPHPTMGYYSARPVKGLRLICLNTVIYVASYKPVDGTNQLTDGNTQMTWLAAQLADAKAKKEKVYIALHVPPGMNAYSNNSMWVKLPAQKISWLNSFLSLTTKYQATIAGILYGHTHMDELRRLYDPTGKRITEVAISCPGVTPQHNNNPGFKTVTYDAISKELMDFTTFYTTPVNTSWGTNTYTFSSTFSSTPGKSIYQQLSGMTLNNITSSMNNIFTVKNGPAGYNTQTGIEVKWGQ